MTHAGLFRRRLFVLIGLPVLLLILIGRASAANTVLDVAYNDGRFNTWTMLVNRVALTNLVTRHGPFTVFPPTDAAFAALPAGALDALMADNTRLRQTLLYHIVPGKLTKAQLAAQTSWRTALGEPLTVRTADGALLLNNTARVIWADRPASNGMVHGIDAVLTPPPVTPRQPVPPSPSIQPGSLLDVLNRDPRFSLFVSQVVTAGMEHLYNRRGPFTIFAPTNAAFEALPGGLLCECLTNHTKLRQLVLYHMAQGRLPAADLTGRSALRTTLGKDVQLAVVGGTLTLDGRARVTQSDLPAVNGMIHVLDAVLIPPPGDYGPPQVARPGEGSSILHVLYADPRLDRFAGLMSSAGLGDLLTKHGPFTVFAPTNAAFELLSPDELCPCLENRTFLKQRMLYHIAIGRWDGAAVAGQTQLRTALGKPLTISTLDGRVVLDGRAQVVVTDLPAANGVIHVIDVVLRPPR